MQRATGRLGCRVPRMASNVDVPRERAPRICLLVDELDRAVSRDEIRRAVWNCGENKSPGPDGYTVVQTELPIILLKFLTASILRLVLRSTLLRSKSLVSGFSECLFAAANRFGLLFRHSFRYLGVTLGSVPKGVLKTMESIRSKFFNGVDSSDRKISWVAWDNVLASKLNGGLGVSSFFALNSALLLKWVWRFISGDGSLWYRWTCDLSGDGEFKVKVIRNFIDDLFLHSSDVETRWVKFIPNKVNVFSGVLVVDRLPTNPILPYVFCWILFCFPLCNAAMEEICSILRIGYAWFLSFRLSSRLKSILEGDDLPSNGYDQNDVQRLCARLICLREMKEEVLVRSGLKMSIYDFMTLLSWSDAKIVEESHHLFLPLLERVPLHTTASATEGAIIPLPTPDEIVASLPDSYLSKKSRGPSLVSRPSKKRKLQRRASEAGYGALELDPPKGCFDPTPCLGKRLGAPSSAAVVSASELTHAGTLAPASTSVRSLSLGGAVVSGRVGKYRAEVMRRQMDSLDCLARSALARDA
ncbi:hypothetical protein Tco_0811763 [Tanacetum coccineum]